MGIRQIVIFECDECGFKCYMDREVLLFDEEPIVPEGDKWAYCGWSVDERLMCPPCVQKWKEDRGDTPIPN